MKCSKVKLITVCDILDSKRVPVTKKDRKQGIYPYYGANGFQGYIDDYIFDDELVLVAEDGGNFGSNEKPIAYRVSGKCWVNNHAHVLKPKDGLDVDYLCYSLMFYDVENIISGSTRKKLTQAALQQMTIIYQPLTEQRRISAVLGKAIDLIALRKRQLEMIDELVKARFIEMFGDPVTNPIRWVKKSYNDISILITDGEHATPIRSSNGIPLLSARNISNHSFRLNDVDYITEQEFSRIAKRIEPQKGDILISCSGSIGRVCSIPEGMRLQLVRSVALVRFKKEINPVFAEYLIDTGYTQKQIKQLVNQSSQANLFQGQIRRIEAIVPPIKLQEEFADFVEKVEKLRLEMSRGLDTMETSYYALLQEYFG